MKKVQEHTQEEHTRKVLIKSRFIDGDHNWVLVDLAHDETVLGAQMEANGWQVFITTPYPNEDDR